MKFNFKWGKPLCVLALAVIVASCGGAEERKEKYLEKGKIYLHERNYDKARIEFKNVIQIDPKYAEVYYYLGELEKDNQNWKKSFSYFKKAVELEPSHVEAKLELAKMYVATNELDKVAKLKGEISVLAPDHYGIQLLQSLIYSREGEIGKAITILKKSIEKDSREDMVLLLSSLYKKEEQYQQAIAVLNEALDRYPGNIEIHVELLKNYTNLEDEQAIEKTLKKLISLDEENAKFKVVLSSFYAKRGKLDEAESILRQMIAEDADDAERYILLAKFLASKKNVELAEKELLAVIKSHPDLVDVSFGLADLYLKSNQVQKAKDIYKGIIEKFSVEKEGLQARNYLINIYFSEGKMDVANQLINEVLAESPKDSNALFYKANTDLYNKKTSEAINGFRVLLKERPNSLKVAALLADAYLLEGKRELAEQTLKSAVQNNQDDPQAYYYYARFLASAGDAESAYKYFELALDIDPLFVPALKDKADFLMKSGRFSEAISTIEKIKAVDGQEVYAHKLLSQMYMYNNEREKALVELDQASLIAPDDSKIIGAIIQVLTLDEKFSEAESRLLKRLEQKNSADGEAVTRDLLARVYLAQNKTQQSINEFEKAINLKQSWHFPYLGLANLLIKENKEKDAIDLLKQAIYVVDDKINISIMLAGLYEKAGDFDDAIDVYEKILYSGNIVARNNYASLIADHRSDNKEQLKAALEMVQGFDKAKQPLYKDTLGWVLFKNGEIEKAIPVLEGVIKSAPDEGEVQYHLGASLHGAKRLEEAKHYLKLAVENEQEFVGKEEAKRLLDSIK